MGFQIDRMDDAFLGAGSIALALIKRTEVVDHWAEPSALPKMSIGALACHLGRQLNRAAELLPVKSDVVPLDAVDDHYAALLGLRRPRRMIHPMIGVSTMLKPNGDRRLSLNAAWLHSTQCEDCSKTTTPTAS